MPDSNGGYLVDEEHFQIAEEVLSNLDMQPGTLNQDYSEEEVEKVYAAGESAAEEMDDKQVIDLFIKSDWDLICNGVSTREAKLGLMRQVVALNISDAMLQKLIRTEPQK